MYHSIIPVHITADCDPMIIFGGTGANLRGFPAKNYHCNCLTRFGKVLDWEGAIQCSLWNVYRSVITFDDFQILSWNTLLDLLPTAADVKQTTITSPRDGWSLWLRWFRNRKPLCTVIYFFICVVKNEANVEI